MGSRLWRVMIQIEVEVQIVILSCLPLYLEVSLIFIFSNNHLSIFKVFPLSG
jgi:hypothetical protein